MAGPHFDISAAVVRQLGEELVSDEVTAIVELVKNAYDADADYAHVVVNTADSPPASGSKFPNAVGYITIEDDGMGMDRTDIERGWLMISFSGKRVMKAAGGVTPRGRTPLGDKGLGRLSTQKLGQNLELYTRKDGRPETQHVAFAWNAFTDDKSVSEVPVIIEPAAAARAKGTMLVISGLRSPEVWRGGAVNKLIADLSW
jgi:HSP90 family molecular chaperone